MSNPGMKKALDLAKRYSNKLDNYIDDFTPQFIKDLSPEDAYYTSVMGGMAYEGGKFVRGAMSMDVSRIQADRQDALNSFDVNAQKTLVALGSWGIGLGFASSVSADYITSIPIEKAALLEADQNSFKQKILEKLDTPMQKFYYNDMEEENLLELSWHQQRLLAPIGAVIEDGRQKYSEILDQHSKRPAMGIHEERDYNDKINHELEVVRVATINNIDQALEEYIEKYPGDANASELQEKIEYYRNTDKIYKRVLELNDGEIPKIILAKDKNNLSGQDTADGDVSPCFAEGTLISLGGGATKKIEDIIVGDEVLAFDGFGELQSRRVLNLKRQETDHWVELFFSDGRENIKATEHHEMFTPAGDFKPLGTLIGNVETGSIDLVDVDGKTISVQFKKIYLVNPEVTYNFEVEGLHTYIAGGLRVHNDCTLIVNFDQWDSMSGSEQYAYLQGLSESMVNDIDFSQPINLSVVDGSMSTNAKGILLDFYKDNSKISQMDPRDFTFTAGDGTTEIVFGEGDLSRYTNTRAPIDIDTEEYKSTDGTTYTFARADADVNIDGVSYTAGAIVDSIKETYDALSDYTLRNIEAVDYGKVMDNALMAAFTEIGYALANGQNLDEDDVVRIFARKLGAAFGTEFLAESASSLATEIDNFVEGTVFEIDGLGGSVTNTVIRFAITAAIEGHEWDSDEYLKAGRNIAIQEALKLAAANSGIFGSSAQAGGAAAAAAVVVTSFLDDPDMNSDQWRDVGAQATIAGLTTWGASAAASAITGATASFATLAGAATFGIGLVIGIAAGALISKAIGGGVRIGPGEAQSWQGVADQLWGYKEVQHTDFDEAGNEVTKMVDALYVKNLNGETLNKDYLLNETDFLPSGFNPLILLGSSQSDNIIGNDDSETLISYAGSDFIDAKGGDNQITAGVTSGDNPSNLPDNDVVLSGNGNDIIRTGMGDDYVSVSGGDNIVILGDGHDRAYIGNGDDIINAGNGEDYIEAGHGNNTIIIGNPTLDDGGNIISDTDKSQNEVYTGHGNDNITGSAGRDIITSGWQNDATDAIFGAVGKTGSANAYIASLESSSIILDNHTKSLIRQVFNGTLDPYIDLRNDNINAGDGGDLVVAGLGKDTVHGGRGDDVIIGGGFLEDHGVGTGTDYDLDIIYGEAGDDVILGDSLIPQNASYLNMTQVMASHSADFIDGGIGNDYLDGGGSDDTLVGGLGDDVLVGGTGNDDIRGGDGLDYLVGGRGNDILDGGTGIVDMFVFKKNDGHDIIRDSEGSNRLLFLENTINQLTMTRQGNNLIVTTNNGGKVTVEGHFNGSAAHYIYDSNNNVYSLSEVTADNVADGAAAQGVFYTDKWMNRANDLENRIKASEGIFKDVTSPFAKNEHSSWYDTNYYTEADQDIDNQQINGTQIGWTKRKRGWSGHYNVFYQIQRAYIIGDTEYSFEGAGPTIDVGRVDKGQYDYILEIWDEYYVGDGRQWWHITDNNHLEGGELSDEFNDLIIGAYWQETIKTLDGDDVIFSNSGDDNINLGDGNDFAHGGDGTDIIHGDGLEGGLDGIFKLRFNGHHEGNYILIENETSHDALLGGAGDDTLYGELGNDTLNGDSGDDTIYGDLHERTNFFDVVIPEHYKNEEEYLAYIEAGTSSDDYIEGNAGDDVIVDLEGHAIIDGGSGDDNITTGAGNDLVHGGDGTDTVRTGHGLDTIYGGGGRDILFGQDGNDFIHGGDGFDSIDGGRGDDVLYGGNSFDQIRAGTGNDYLYGGYGNDTLMPFTGNNYIDGGAGYDKVSYHDVWYGMNLDFGEYYTGGKSYLVNVEQIEITNHNDTLRGTSYADNVMGLNGNDTLYGRQGNDRLQGMNGNDTLRGDEGDDNLFGASGTDTLYGGVDDDNLYGGDGNDKLYGENGNDALYGEAGRDTIHGGNGDDVIHETDLDDDTINGGSGYDTLSYEDNAQRVTVTLTSGTSGTTSFGDSFSNINLIIGSQLNDTIHGNSADNELDGHIGADTINAGGGDDIIYDRDGDGIQAGDIIDGGDGFDTYSLVKKQSGVTMRINSVGDAVTDRNDTLKNIELYLGSNGHDRFIGSDDSDLIDGYWGTDTISGNGGNDIIYDGDNRRDIINGGDGIDTISFIGRPGRIELRYDGDVGTTNYDDTITNIERFIGSVGSDYFVLSAQDDYIDLGTGLDFVEAYHGDDYIVDSDDQQDSINGHLGNDTISYAFRTSGINIAIDSDGIGVTQFGAELRNIPNVIGSSYNDTILTNHAVNYIEGGAGDDWINAAAGDDHIVDIQGYNTIIAGKGFDVIEFSASAHVVYGGDEDNGGDGYRDIFRLSSWNGSSGSDYVIADFDVNIDVLALEDLGIVQADVSLSQVGNLVSFDINKGANTLNFDVQLSSDTSFDIANVSFADNLYDYSQVAVAPLDPRWVFNDIFGSWSDDVIYGEDLGSAEKKDRINALGGNDTVYGGEGNDILYGSSGADTFFGGEGKDVVSYRDLNEAVHINMRTEEYTQGDASNDTFESIEGFEGSNVGDDILTDNDGDNILRGWGGNDEIYAGAGDDHIHGNMGDDIIVDLEGYNDISGGPGADKIYFSASSHRIYDGNYGSGGDGYSDEFILSSWHENTDMILQEGDVIGSFEVGIDVLNLAELGIEASHVTLGKFSNGEMVHIDTGDNQLSFGLRTGNKDLNMSDILFAT